MATKIPNGHKMLQHFTLQDRPKYIPNGIFGSKIYYLATLAESTYSSRNDNDKSARPSHDNTVHIKIDRAHAYLECNSPNCMLLMFISILFRQKDFI
jgi:hypothetical protein